MGEYLRSAMSRTWRARLGYLLARGAFNVLREKMDPRKMNGGLFLGLNGLVIKSHGGTDAEGFAAALDLGYDVARHELVHRIAGNIARSERGLLTAERVAS
jgi:glycerol-3-phosphate acyltransferase PlsX